MKTSDRSTTLLFLYLSIRSLKLPSLLIAAAFTIPLRTSAAEEKAAPPLPSSPDSALSQPAPKQEAGAASEAKAPQPRPLEAARVVPLPPEKKNAFALSLIRRLSQNAKAQFLDNSILCPGGVTRLLRALHEGVKGTGAAEIAKALALDSKASEKSPGAFDTPAPDLSVVLKTGSAIWCDPATPFVPKFEKTAAETFGAKAHNVPLHSNSDSARKTINAWAAEQTGGNIQELLKPKDLVGATVVLTDTAWFQDTWKDRFRPEKSTEHAFTLPDDAKRNVLFVSDSRTARIGSTADAQALALPFSTPGLECLCVLPTLKEKESAGAALLRFEQNLKPETVTALLAALNEEKRVQILLPKLDIKGLSSDLIPMLKSLGIKAIFRNADFTPMVKNAGGIFVSAFKQDTAFRLDETGAEASAATVTLMSKGVSPLANTFHADRPCIFLIRNTETGELVFYIRCVAPPEAPKTAAPESSPTPQPSPAESGTAPSPVQTPATPDASK